MNTFDFPKNCLDFFRKFFHFGDMVICPLATGVYGNGEATKKLQRYRPINDTQRKIFVLKGKFLKNCNNKKYKISKWTLKPIQRW